MPWPSWRPPPLEPSLCTLYPARWREARPSPSPPPVIRCRPGAAMLRSRSTTGPIPCPHPGYSTPWTTSAGRRRSSAWAPRRGRAPRLVEEISARGHEVGVHGYEHRSHLRRPAPPVISDVRRSARLLAELTGTTPEWLRPPYGALSLSSLAASRQCGLRTILWTTWGLDWQPGATGAPSPITSPTLGGLEPRCCSTTPT